MWWQIYPSVRDFYRQLHLLCGNDLKWLQKCYLCLKWLIVKAFNQPWWSLIPIHSPNLTFHWTIFQKDNVPMVHAISSNEKSNSSSHPFVASSFLVTFTLSLKNDQMWGFSLLFHLSSYRVISWSVVSLIFQIKCKWASWIWDRKKKKSPKWRFRVRVRVRTLFWLRTEFCGSGINHFKTMNSKLFLFPSLSPQVLLIAWFLLSIR